MNDILIYQDKLHNIIKYPADNKGYYLISRKQGNGHLIKVEIPEHEVIEKLVLIAKHK